MSNRCCHDAAQFAAGAGRGRGSHGRCGGGPGSGCGRAGAETAGRKERLEASRKHLEERLAAVNEELNNL
jgi:hypothetical protein